MGKGTRLTYGGSTWRFVTPRGVHRVLARERNPAWVPPLWHYARPAGTPVYIY